MSNLYTPLAVSEETAAELLGVTPEAVALLIEAGELETVRVGLILRVLYVSLEAFLFGQVSPLAAQRIRDHLEKMKARPWWDRLCDESRRVEPKPTPARRAGRAASDMEPAPAG